MALRTNVHRLVYSWQQSHEVGTVMTHILQWEKGGPQTWPPAACVCRVFIWYQRCAKCYAYVNSFILAVIPWGKYYYYPYFTDKGKGVQGTYLPHPGSPQMVRGGARLGTQCSASTSALGCIRPQGRWEETSEAGVQIPPGPTQQCYCVAGLVSHMPIELTEARRNWWSHQYLYWPILWENGNGSQWKSSHRWKESPDKA